MRTIDFTNYFESTKVTFECMAESYKAIILFLEMKESGLYEFKKSPKSGSQYLLDKENGIVYRWSNHWGKVASCQWDLENSQYPEIAGAVAKANISDFTELN